jgi:hypothetical protein
MTTNFLQNYRLKEIELIGFCTRLHPLYELLTRKADPIAVTIWCAFIDVEEVPLLYAATHNLHLELSTCFPGWKRLDHSTEVFNDETRERIVWDTKYKTDEHERNRLLEACVCGYKIYLVNEDNTSDFTGITVQKAYTILSKRNTFFGDLKAALRYIFLNFKTYDALMAAIS